MNNPCRATHHSPERLQAIRTVLLARYATRAPENGYIYMLRWPIWMTYFIFTELELLDLAKHYHAQQLYAHTDYYIKA